MIVDLLQVKQLARPPVLGARRRRARVWAALLDMPSPTAAWPALVLFHVECD